LHLYLGEKKLLNFLITPLVYMMRRGVLGHEMVIDGEPSDQKKIRVVNLGHFPAWE